MTARRNSVVISPTVPEGRRSAIATHHSRQTVGVTMAVASST